MNYDEDFRERFYRSYYADQAGRGEVSLQKKVSSDQRHYRNLILPLLPDNSKIRILDAGCGYGSLVDFLVKSGYQNVEGVDISEDQIKQARAMGVERVIQADLFEFLEGDQRWDVIIGLDLIEHFTKAEVVRLLKLVYESLSEGGRFIGRTPNIDAPFGTVYAYGDFTHGLILNGSSAVQLFETMNFSNVEIMPEPVKYRTGMKGWIQRLGFRGMRGAAKFLFFITGRSISEVVLTPNMIIRADR